MQKVKGVDISEMNGSVDFGTLRRAGVEFVIIRCGFGSDDPDQDDKEFAANVRKADAVGMPWGAYLYSYAVNRNMALSEARHVRRLLNGRKPAYGVWYDVEDGSQAGADLVELCVLFCSEMEKLGLYAGIYSMLAWMETKLDSPRLDRYDKWVAQWAGACDYGKPYGIWQYMDRLNIGGKAFDGNVAYKDYPALTGNVKKEEIDMTKDEVIKLVQDTARKTVQDELTRAEKARSQADMPKWAQAEAALSRERGIYLGDSNGNLRPMDYTTKVETAVMVNRGVDAAVNLVRGLMEDRNG